MSVGKYGARAAGGQDDGMSDVLDAIDDVVADWQGSADSMHWRPDLIEEIDRRQREELAAIARLITEHTDATFEEALNAVTDVNEYGTDSRGWPLCFGAMRTALAPYVAPVLAKVPPEGRDEALRMMTPSMLSAFKQMAALP
jgi:hypothetical protein